MSAERADGVHDRLPDAGPRGARPRPSPGSGTAGAQQVTFVQHADDGDVAWSVEEVDASDVPGAHGRRCLIFRRRDCIRRVWDYPADWRTLDAAGLVALSWHR